MYMSEEKAGLCRNIMAVSNRHLCRRPLEEQLERVCRCRPRALILREKDLPKADSAPALRGRSPPFRLTESTVPGGFACQPIRFMIT